MIQCFVKKEYEAPFGLTQMPRLFSVSRTDEKASAHPRVMHAHDDLVEIVLVRGGESRYFVGGTPDTNPPRSAYFRAVRAQPVRQAPDSRLPPADPVRTAHRARRGC